MIALFLAPFYLLVNGYVLQWLFAWARVCSSSLDTIYFRLPATILYLFVALSPLTGFLVTANPWHRILKTLGNYWIGTFAYILLTILFFDGVRRITRIHFFIRNHAVAALHSSDRTLFYSGCFVLILIIGISVYGVLHSKRLYVREWAVTLDKCSPIPNLRLVLLADLHLGYNSTKGQIRRLVDAINRQNPDLVCLAGDIFDNEYDAVGDAGVVASILADIKSRYGAYACFGNHDVSEKILAGFTFDSSKKLPEDPRYREFLSAAHIRMLEDEVILVDNSFYLAGRKDPAKAMKENDQRLSCRELVSGLDKTKPLIVMDHQPRELSEAAAAGVDLELSGHTHNGQMFPANLFVKFQWEHPCGVRKKGDMYSVVTSGTGVWGPGMRVGTDSEIVVLDVKFGQDPS